MQDEGVIYVAGHPLLNRRCTRLPGCFYFPKWSYSLTALKVPLNSNQSINLDSEHHSIYWLHQTTHFMHNVINLTFYVLFLGKPHRQIMHVLCGMESLISFATIKKTEIPAPMWTAGSGQLQPKVSETVQHHVSYEFIWIHRTCDYI